MKKFLRLITLAGTLFLYLPLCSRTYTLNLPDPNAGFFSIFNGVVGALDYYEQKKDCDGLVIDFGTQGLYYDANRGPNWWEYYFEPIRINAHDPYRTEFPNYKKIILSLTGQFDLSRTRAYELIKKYIHLKPHIHNKLQTFMQQHFAQFHVIGIHYRGTDKHAEAPTVSYEHVASTVRKELASNAHVRFFVATDDENFLVFMHKEFPGRVVSRDALRSKDGKPVHFAKHLNAYQKGEDAVLDCLLLSRCAKLYKMASNLSDTSLKLNPTLPVVRFNVSFFEV